MNKKIFVATINWAKTNETRKIIGPLNNPTYSPQISDDGEYVINGSSWSVFCYNFKMIVQNRTKSLVKYLNQNSHLII